LSIDSGIGGEEVNVEALIDAREAAKMLHISIETIRRHSRAGEIPHVRLGKRVLYRASTLNAWIAEQELESVRPLAAKEKE